MSSADTTDSVQRKPSGMRFFLTMFLVVHIPLFIYPVLRLCGWLDIGPLVTTLLLIPIASSQVISRWLLRDVKQPLARGLRHAADYLLGLSPILLIALLCFEVVVSLSLIDVRSAALIVLGSSLLVSAVGVLFALMPAVKKISFESSREF